MIEAQEQIIQERELDWPPIILLIIAALIMLTAYGLYHVMDSRAEMAPYVNSISNINQPALIRSSDALVNLLDSPQIDGSTVLLNPVRVDSLVGDYMFMIDLGQNKKLPVVLLGEITDRQPENKVEVKAGGMVRIFGFILPLDDIRLLTRPGFFSEADQRMLRTQSHYISAVRVVVLDQ